MLLSWHHKRKEEEEKTLELLGFSIWNTDFEQMF